MDISKFTGYEWDASNLSKLRRHRVKRAEFEEAMKNGAILWEVQSDNGEDRFKEVGHTNTGRVLFVVWTPRDNLIRPITAYDTGREVAEEYLAIRFEGNKRGSMEIKQEIKPMTPQEIAEEDAYAEKCYQESKSITREQAHEILSQQRRSPAYGFSIPSPKAASLNIDVDQAAEDLMGKI